MTEMPDSRVLQLLKENINAQMKLLLLLGGCVHLGFVLLSVIFKIYPITLFSLLASVLFICAGIFIRRTNFLFFYIFTFIEIIINIIFTEITIGDSFGFSLYFFALIPISTYILSSEYKRIYQLFFISTALISNIIAYIFFSLVFPQFSSQTILSTTVSLLFYSFNATGVGFMIGFLSLYFILNTLSRYAYLQSENSLLQEASHKDELTGLYNRRFMNEFLKDNFFRKQQEFCLCIADIDYFKNFNDKYGHDAGDLILRTLSFLFTPFCEKENLIVCRWGGEEFLFYFPFPPKKAETILNQLRTNIEKSVLSYENTELRITMTFGISKTAENYHSLDEMIKEADTNLYVGKNQGRNCVII